MRYVVRVPLGPLANDLTPIALRALRQDAETIAAEKFGVELGGHMEIENFYGGMFGGLFDGGLAGGFQVAVWRWDA